MVELNIQAYADREKLVIALVNSGYTVKVVEKPDPKRYLGKLYYVQVIDAEENPINITFNISGGEKTDLAALEKYLSEKMIKGLCELNNISIK